MNIDAYEGPAEQVVDRLWGVVAWGLPPAKVGDAVPELGPGAVVSAIEPGLITVSMRAPVSAEDVVMTITAAPSTSDRP